MLIILAVVANYIACNMAQDNCLKQLIVSACLSQLIKGNVRPDTIFGITSIVTVAEICKYDHIEIYESVKEHYDECRKIVRSYDPDKEVNESLDPKCREIADKYEVSLKPSPQEKMLLLTLMLKGRPDS